jgi:uncharacterized protein
VRFVTWLYAFGETGEERMADPKIEVYKDRGKEYRWRLKSGNGRTIADSGEGYKTPSGAQRAAETVKKSAAKAKVVKPTPSTPKATPKKSAAKRPTTKNGGGTKKASSKRTSSTRRRSG